MEIGTTPFCPNDRTIVQIIYAATLSRRLLKLTMLSLLSPGMEAIVPKASVITQEFQAIQAALEVLEPLDPTQRQFAVSMILSRLRMEAAPGATLRAWSHPSTVAGAGCTAATGPECS